MIFSKPNFSASAIRCSTRFTALISPFKPTSPAKHILGEAGITRGLKALSALNQTDGYDCPSCAWPDPDDERSSIAEYCENGAKAIAEEATTKKLTAKLTLRDIEEQK